MYPISFDNPNGRARPQRAANRNIAPGSGATENVADGTPVTVFGDEDRLLVVECRTDDRWRVVLCTGLEDLDDALDTVRNLRRAEGTDEVSLTIEVSGHQGRESRREVVRFAKESAAETQSPAHTSPAAPLTAGFQSAEMQAMEAAFAAVSPAFKMPDISYDDMILPQDIASAAGPAPDTVNDGRSAHKIAATPEELAEAIDEVSLSSLAWEDDVIQTHETRPKCEKKITSDDIPEFLKVPAPAMDADTGADQDMSLGMDAMVDQASAGDDFLNESDEAEEEVDMPDLTLPMSNDPFAADRFEPRHRTPQSFASNSQHSWIDDLLNKNSPAHTHSTRGQSDTPYNTDDDDEEYATRLESPMFARENGVTAKVLVFAGTVALLILGGALAELLAVDITSSANAETHFLDDSLTLTLPLD